MSERYAVDKFDLKKIATGALVAAAGAVLTYIVDQTAGLSDGMMPVVYILASTALNALRKFLTDGSKNDSDR